MLAILGGPTATAACGADGGGFGFADVAIGALRATKGRTPCIVTDEMVAEMKMTIIFTGHVCILLMCYYVKLSYIKSHK